MNSKGKFISSLIMSTIISTMSVFMFSASTLPVSAADTTASINVNAGSVNYTIPDTFYGCNLAAWTGNEDGKDLLKNEITKSTNRKLFRWPGGSWGDAYIWDDMEVGGNSWIISYTECLNFLDKVGGTMQPIVNCGGVWNGVQHTNEEAVAKAVAWVKDMNITRKLGVKYWEIGNELYGSWEEGYTNGKEYAKRYCNFYKAMKAVDPTIKCGAVAVETEDGWSNWTPSMLAEFKAQGITPDFLIIHFYPSINNQAVNAANDAACLKSVDSVKGITSNLNSMISKYMGSAYVGKIEYAMTEFNAMPAEHLYIDAMFDSQMLLECAKNKWIIANPWMEDAWYRNGYVTPTYYIFPFLQNKFGRQMVNATSSNSMVRSYAAKDSDGNLTMYIVNNSPTDKTTANIAVSGFTPAASGEKWVIEPVRTGLDNQIPNSTVNQEWDDVKINNVVHPDVRLLDEQVAPAVISTGNSFTVNLPASSMVFLKLLPEGKTPVTHTVTAPASLMVTNPPSASGQIKVQYKCSETAESASSSRFSFNIVNTGDKEVQLSDVVLRYWFTREGTIGWEAFNCDWAEKIPKTSVTATYFNIYHYMDIHFSSGTIPAGGSSGEVQIRWNYGDTSKMDQTNDYSFSPSMTKLADYTKMTLYRNGELIWGTEPAGLRAPKLLSSAPVSEIKYGDLNGDDTVNAIDYALLKSYLLGTRTEFPSANGLKAADVDKSGEINVIDFACMRQYLLGVIPSLPTK